MSEDLPHPTPPPYPLTQARAPIVVYSGPLEVTDEDGTVVVGDGRIELQLAPTLRFRFVIPNPPLSTLSPGPGTLAIPDPRATMPTFVTEVVIGAGGRIVGSVNASPVHPTSEIVEVRFFLANLPNFRGESLHEDDGAPLGAFWAGRLALASREWRVVLDQRRDYKEVYRSLEADGGFEITHIGSLRRADGSMFSDVDASEALNALTGFLGLAAGAWATPIAAVGLDERDDVIWHEWNTRWASPWRSRFYPFDRLKHRLGEAFGGYLDRWSDPIWNEPLGMATQTYVETNGPLTVDLSIVLGQALLELLAWVRFVEDAQSHSAADFNNPRRQASQRLRELLEWLEVDPGIPASLVDLTQESAQREWDDGPHAIVEMRNSLVHPHRRQRLISTPVRARIEVRELLLWYTELSMLRVIGYDGPYANRLGARVTGVTDDVPWA